MKGWKIWSAGFLLLFFGVWFLLAIVGPVITVILAILGFFLMIIGWMSNE